MNWSLSCSVWFSPGPAAWAWPARPERLLTVSHERPLYGLPTISEAAGLSHTTSCENHWGGGGAALFFHGASPEAAKLMKNLTPDMEETP